MKKILKYSLLPIFCSIIGAATSQSSTWDIRPGTLHDHVLGGIGNGADKIVVYPRAVERYSLDSLSASELTLQEHALAESKIGSMCITTISDIAEYALERAEIGALYAESIKKIAGKGFARVSNIGILSVGTIENIGERSFEHAQIVSVSVEEMSSLPKSALAHAKIKSFDVRNMGDLSGSEYGFEHVRGLTHLGLSDNIPGVHPSCFQYCDFSSLENLTIYCQTTAGNKIMELAGKLDNGGFGKTGSLSKFKTLNIALGANLFDVSKGTAVKHTEWAAFINGIVSGVKKEKSFAGITALNIFLGDLVSGPVKLAKGSLTASPNVTGCTISLYEGTPSVYTGLPKDVGDDLGDENGTGKCWLFRVIK